MTTPSKDVIVPLRFLVLSNMHSLCFMVFLQGLLETIDHLTVQENIVDNNAVKTTTVWFDGMCADERMRFVYAKDSYLGYGNHAYREDAFKRLAQGLTMILEGSTPAF